ncbi:hypothetical protein [Acaryochloris sp. CCMEE 5410]|uniref:hypothetical protein n=1 Tax=Acaryochloris sp. CCMEE 5410 TaxID=310037 RepID=UPI0005854732|nr:hypothetical protein [Acaryochloris sp. CCMEE 5410]
MAYSLGLGIPIILADLQSAPNYDSYIGQAVMFMGLWVGIPQWLVLRRKLTISAQWIWFSFAGYIISVLLLLWVARLLPSSDAAVRLCLFPLIISLGQWHVLRQRLQPAWSWVPASCFALFAGGCLGILLGGYLYLGHNAFGISALAGGLTCGLVYSLITAVALRYITQQKYTSPKSSKPASKQDTPPDHKTWVDTVITLLPLLVIIGGWLWLLPPIPSSGLPYIVEAFIFLGIFYLYQYFAIFIHELGHYLFAWANGSELYRFAIGRLILFRTDQGLSNYVSAVNSLQEALLSLSRHLYID